jgi:hypothetical protein
MSQALRDGRLGFEHAMGRMLTRERLIATSTLVGLTFVVALLEHRVEPSLAVNRSLATTMGVMLPLLTWSVVRRDANDTGLSLLERHGAHRRWLMLGDQLGSLLWLSMLSVLAIAITRYLTRQATDRFLVSDLSTCVGIGLLGVVGYAGTLTLVGRWGRGVVASSLLLVMDFWLGHTDSVVSFLTVRGHLRNLLFGVEGTSLSPSISSYLLISMGLVGWLITALRTRP